MYIIPAPTTLIVIGLAATQLACLGAREQLAYAHQDRYTKRKVL